MAWSARTYNRHGEPVFFDFTPDEGYMRVLVAGVELTISPEEWRRITFEGDSCMAAVKHRDSIIPF